MTLIITAIAAITVTVIRFLAPETAQKCSLGTLALMYSGAAIMWVIDGFAALAEGEPFVELTNAPAMADDTLLGLCVIALGLIAWGVVLLVKHWRTSQVSATV